MRGGKARLKGLVLDEVGRPLNYSDAFSGQR